MLAPRAVHAGSPPTGDVGPVSDHRRCAPTLPGALRQVKDRRCGAVDGDGLSGSIASAPPGAPAGGEGESAGHRFRARRMRFVPYGRSREHRTARPGCDARRRASGRHLHYYGYRIAVGALELSGNSYARLRRQELPANPTRYRPIAASLNSSPWGWDGALTGGLGEARGD